MGKRGRPPYPDILTPREWEVLALIRESLTNEEIASRLGISLDGVKYHVSEILGKLGVENRREAARWRPEEARPWWLVAAAPLLFWRRLSFGWLSLAIAGTLAVAVAAGIGLLVWALLATRGGEPTTAVGLPAGDRLAYVGTDENLWLLEGGGRPRPLTEDGDIYYPRWSPDGRRLLFLRNEAPPATAPPLGNQLPSLWLADVTSGEAHQLDPGPVRLPDEPWSPDGERLAYTKPSADGQVYSVWLSDVDGEAHQVLAEDFGAWDVAWSPDGERLAVARNLPPDYPDDWNAPGAHVEIPEENGVYIIDPDGAEPQPVVLVQAIQRAWEEGEGLELGRSSIGVTGVGRLWWSPDGRYLSFQPVTLSVSLMADGPPLFTVPADGGAPAYHGVMLSSSALLDWFPDGHRFVFTLGGGREVQFGKRLALAEAGVPGATVIAEDPERLPTPKNPVGGPYDFSIRSDAWPAVSPDGRRIVFQTSEASWDVMLRLDVGKVEGAKEGIWVVNADGSHPRQLTSDLEYLDFFPQWSADGESILFVRTDGRPFAGDFAGEGSPSAELWIMRADGTDPRPLVTDALRIGSYYGLFAWEQDLAWHRGE